LYLAVVQPPRSFRRHVQRVSSQGSERPHDDAHGCRVGPRTAHH
jgi:hypothetical protein